MAITIKSDCGNYGGSIHKRRDGRVDVYFLYNMADPTHSMSSGDVSTRKSYASEKTARRKIAAWIAENK